MVRARSGADGSVYGKTSERERVATTKKTTGATKKPAAKKPAAAKAKATDKAKPAAKAKPVKTSVGEIAAPKRAKKPAEAEAPESKRVALAVADAGLDKKAVNVEIIDVIGKVDYADYVVVMSGRSDRQVQALARGIAEDVEKKTKTKCLGVEGIPQASWVLMDFGDVVVHIFHDDIRGYYDLESLWMDASRISVPSSGPA